MRKIIPFVFAIAIVYLFYQYNKGISKQHVDVVRINSLLEKPTDLLKNEKEVLFASNNSSDEFFFKTQLGLSPVVLRKWTSTPSFKHEPILLIQDFRLDHRTIVFDALGKDYDTIWTEKDSLFYLIILKQKS